MRNCNILQFANLPSQREQYVRLHQGIKKARQTITLTYRAICLHSWIIPPEESLKGHLLPEQSYREGQYP